MTKKERQAVDQKTALPPRLRARELYRWIPTSGTLVSNGQEVDANFMNNIPGSRTIHVPAGELIYREGDKATTLYLLSQGRAFIFSQGKRRRHQGGRREQPSEARVIMQWLDAPAVLGEGVLHDTKRHTSSARAIKPSTLVAVEDIGEAFQGRPDVVEKTFSLLSQRIRGQQRHRDDVLLKPVETATAATLLYVLDDNGGRITEQDIADTLGISRESVSKVCSQFKEVGILELGWELKIIDRKRLTAIVARAHGNG